jgi:hypothetical protein
MSAEGPSILNRYKSHEKKQLQPYPEERAPAAVAAEKEAERIKERDRAWAAKAVKVKPVPLNLQERVQMGSPAAANRNAAEHGSPEEKAEQYNRAVQLGMSESNKVKVRETQAEVNRREAARIAGKAGEVEVNLEEEASGSLTFTLDQGYIDAIKVPDTYFNIITSVKNS